MGCASSNPLVEGGKSLMNNAKQATDNVIGMGEKAMHDAGDAVNTGIDHVKQSVESGISAAQNSIGSVVNNVESTLGLAKSKAEETATMADENVEDLMTQSGDVVEETISDAKTVLAFEDATSKMETEIKQMECANAEAVRQLDALKDEFGESVQMVERKLEETLHVEDVDESAATMATTADGAAAGGKEALAIPPTPWEVAADAIHNRRASIAAIGALEDGAGAADDDDADADFEDVDASPLPASMATSATSTASTSSGALYAAAPAHTSDAYDASTATSSLTTSSKDYRSGNATSDILLSDTISIKSYKSEI